MTSPKNVGLAALPWYNFAATKAGLDEVWHETRALLYRSGVNAVPSELNHSTPYDQFFMRDDLVLSQCCGLDLFQVQADNMIPIAAPILSHLDVTPGNYFSYIVSRSLKNFTAPRVVINNQFSHSGHTTLLVWLAEQGISDVQVSITGSHALSVRALQTGQADLAAIDAHSWNYLDHRGLKIIGRSAEAPAPPFIVGCNSVVPCELMSTALHGALVQHGQKLGFAGIVPVTKRRYTQMAELADKYGLLNQVARARI